MIRYYISFILILLFSEKVFSQLEKSIWHFGPTQYGLYFNAANVPQITSNSYTPYSGEGCSVMTHPITGALVFYSDGSIVIDASHNPMPNSSGLDSHYSAFGTGDFCPVPGSCNSYYLFHTNSAQEVGGGNAYYSVIDMTLPGNGTVVSPLGDIVGTQKNVMLATNVSEAMEIVPKTNSHEYWLMVAKNSGSIDVFNVTGAGISFHSNFPLIGSLTDIRGFKYSPVSQKFCMVSMVENQPSLIADFNPLTGVISNQQIVPGTPMGSAATWWQGMFDCEWSPDGSKLYITKYRVASPVSGGKLYQYDLNLPSNPLQLVYNVSNNNSYSARGLRLGPDGKIYMLQSSPFGISQVQEIAVINSPNSPGTLCNVNATQINMGFDLQNAHGLPEFLRFKNTNPASTNSNLSFTAPCNILVNGNEFSVDLNTHYTDGEGDGLNYTVLSSTGGTSTISNGLFEFSFQVGQTTGISQLLICDDFCYSLCDTITVTITRDQNSAQNLILEDDITICFGASTTISVDSLLTNIQWSTGDNTPGIIVSTQGQIAVSATDTIGCNVYDTVQVNMVNELENIQLGNDSIVCSSDQNEIILSVPGAVSSIQWNDGSTNDTLIVSTSGEYWVTTLNMDGCLDRDTISFVFSQLSNDFLVDSLFDFCGPITLDAGLPGMSYLWSGGESTQHIQVTQTGSYSVTMTDINGCSVSDSVFVSIQGVSQDLIPSSQFSFCTGTDLDISIDTLLNSPVWSTGDLTHEITIANPGIISVSAIDTNGCVQTDTIQIIEIQELDFVYLGNDTTLCDLDSNAFTLLVSGVYSSVQWSNGESDQSIDVISPGVYWVSTINMDGCLDRDSITISESNLNNEIFPDTIIGYCDPIILDPGNIGSVYQWSTGESVQQIVVENSGVYILYVTDAGGCAATDTVLVNISRDTSWLLNIPNVFSPNSDTKNDYFMINGDTDICNDFISVDIFDRWGLLMFHSDEVGFKWDGKAPNGKECPEGIYFVLLRGYYANVHLNIYRHLTLFR